jgi:hypothetical protein
MGGKVPAAIQDAINKNAQLPPALQTTSDGLTGVSQSADQAATDLQKLIDQFTILRDGALDQERANEAWQQSLDDIGKSAADSA